MIVYFREILIQRYTHSEPYASFHFFVHLLISRFIAGPTLRDLSLSYNVITGTVPLAILQNVWTNLDLSYNKITG